MDDDHAVAFLRSVLDAGTKHLLIFEPVAIDWPNRFSLPGIPIERALECLALSASKDGEEKLPQLPVEIYTVDLGDDFQQLSNVQQGENALNTSAEPTIALPRTFLVTFDDDENVSWSEFPTTDGKRTIQAFSNSELAERSAPRARAKRNWDCKPTHFDYQNLTRFLRVVLEAGVELVLIDDPVESVAPDLHSWWGVRLETALGERCIRGVLGRLVA
jgi:hypothetical protein